jgi:hypothetical protein
MGATMSEGDLITAKEVARRLNLRAVSTVWVWAKSGRIPSFRINPRVIRFDWAAVRAALAGHPK